MAKKATANSRTKKATRPKPTVSLKEVVAWLKKQGTKKQIQEQGTYGISATKPFGVKVGELKKYAKDLGPNHELALELWATGRYEAQMLAAMIDDPARVTLAQMNAWAKDFDNWAIVDTACFHLFDRCKHAWKKVPEWAKAQAEFKKRCAFALLWSLSVHDKEAPNSAFISGLTCIEEAAGDERNFVKKAVNMALRAIGKRNKVLNAAAIKTAKRLAKSNDKTAKWVGSHALRELSSAAVQKRLAGT